MEHILLIYQKLIPSAVLCGHVQLSWLAEQGTIEYRHAEVYDVTGEMLTWANVIVIIRGAMEMDWLIARSAKKAGKKLVYVLDDDLLNVPQHIESSTFYNSPKTQKLMHRIMRLCDVFASPSLNLIEKYGEEFSETVLIEEPSLAHEKKEHPEKKTVDVCFAGSLDRTKDLETLLTDVLKRLMEEFGERISITFFGARPAIVDECHLRYLPYQMDYTDYIDVMSRQDFDIGLAPMIPTEFSRYKHYNKYVEYASYGIVGVFSNVEPYTRAIRNGENGLLCENTAEAWYEAIAALINQPEYLRKLRECCQNEAETIYSLKTVSENYYQSVCRCDTVLTGRPVRGFSLHRPGYRIRHFIARCRSFAGRVIRKALKEFGFK